VLRDENALHGNIDERCKFLLIWYFVCHGFQRILLLQVKIRLLYDMRCTQQVLLQLYAKCRASILVNFWASAVFFLDFTYLISFALDLHGKQIQPTTKPIN